MRVTGVNHITLAVSDVDRAIRFYRDVLGCSLRASWTRGAYLEAGTLWICLSYDPATRAEPHPDYTHLAFDVVDTDFDDLADRVRQSAPVWKDNRSEGSSLYFLDPDGHKLELHTGSLTSRMQHCRHEPPLGWKSAD